VKLSDIRKINTYIQTIYDDPLRMAVKFGCECGCGGNDYTLDEWDNIMADVNEAKAVIKKFCTEHNVEVDIEL